MSELIEEYECKANHITEPVLKVSVTLSLVVAGTVGLFGFMFGLNAADRNYEAPCALAVERAEEALSARITYGKYVAESESVILAESKILAHKADHSYARYRTARESCLP